MIINSWKFPNLFIYTIIWRNKLQKITLTDAAYMVAFCTFDQELMGEDKNTGIEAAIHDFLDVPERTIPAEIEESAYRSVFKEGNTGQILRSMIGVTDMTEDGFRAWLNAFEPKAHQLPWIRRLKTMVRNKIDEFAGKSEADAATLKAATGTAVLVSRIINVGAPVPEIIKPAPRIETDSRYRADAMMIINDLSDRIAECLGEQHLTMSLLSAICEFIFEDAMGWIKDGKIDWVVVNKEMNLTPFAKLNRGHDEDLNLISWLIGARHRFEKKGMLDAETRKFFLKNLRNKLPNHVR